MNTNYIIKAGRTMLSKQFIILNDYIGERSHLPPLPPKKTEKEIISYRMQMGKFYYAYR